ncbi:MAG TPA: single-stranded DNA-binding protein [Terriglobia bacterium]|nr:single-stranded DNA-binding protein [Terriglobia bacterium]
MHNRNRFEFIGNIASNPEVTTLESGKKVCNLRIAVNESWKDQQTGERKENTDFFPIVVWNPKTIELVEKWVRKGAYMSIEGKLKETRKEKEGFVYYQTDKIGLRFHFLEPKGDTPDEFGGDDND